MRILNKTRDTLIAQSAAVADTLLKRMKGLMARKNFAPGEALIITPCNSIHTFFMRFPIDVLFVDRDNKIVAQGIEIKPWQVSPIYWRAKFVVELPCGTISSSGTREGDEITLT